MKIKVLVVDDNEVSVSLVKKYFNESDKIQVISSASNGLEAINELNNNYHQLNLMS